MSPALTLLGATSESHRPGSCGGIGAEDSPRAVRGRELHPAQSRCIREFGADAARLAPDHRSPIAKGSGRVSRDGHGRRRAIKQQAEGGELRCTFDADIISTCKSAPDRSRTSRQRLPLHRHGTAATGPARSEYDSARLPICTIGGQVTGITNWQIRPGQLDRA
jgi:hypothetical protein